MEELTPAFGAVGQEDDKITKAATQVLEGNEIMSFSWKKGGSVRDPWAGWRIVEGNKRPDRPSFYHEL